jgi:hypothetical protein
MEGAQRRPPAPLVSARGRYMMSEKLQFSVEDLGRLTREQTRKYGANPFTITYEWLKSFEDDTEQHRALWDRLYNGYTEK